MPTYLLDTNTVSYILTARSQAAQQRFADVRSGDRVVISAITEGEIRYGLAKRPSGARKLELVQRFFDTVERVPWDSSITDAYGTLRFHLASKGQTLGAPDMLIAAHAISLGATLVTHDQAFHRLASLALVVNDWATDL